MSIEPIRSTEVPGVDTNAVVVNTELGRATRIDGVYHLSETFDPTKYTGSLLGHTHIPVSHSSCVPMSDAKRCLQFMPFLLGIFIAKGYQIRLTYHNGVSRVMERNDAGNISFLKPGFWLKGRGTDISQAWSDVLVFKDRNFEYYVPTDGLEKIEAFLAPVRLIGLSDPEDSSVATFIATVNKDNMLEFSFKTRIRHLIHVLASSTTWRAYGEADGRLAGIDRIAYRLFGSDNAYLVSSQRDVIESLYHFGMDSYGQQLYAPIGGKNVTEESLLTILPHNQYRITPLSEMMSQLLGRLRRYAPETAKHYLD